MQPFLVIFDDKLDGVMRVSVVATGISNNDKGNAKTTTSTKKEYK